MSIRSIPAIVRNSWLSASLLIAAHAFAPSAEKQAHYLVPGELDPAILLAAPPEPGSAEQAADMAAVVSAAQSRTTNDAAVAFSEKKFSVFVFAPAIGPFFRAGKFPITENFFSQMQGDAVNATHEAKDYWKRPRPFTINPALATGELEKSFGYPSGHSAESTVLALFLAELFPEKRAEILRISRDIGWHRVQIARHYPTDIQAGRVFAQAIAREMRAKPDFLRDLEAAKKEIAASRGIQDLSGTR